MMKNKNRLWTKVLASVAVGGVMLSGLAALSSSAGGPLVTRASAGVDGGGSSGGGGGGAGGAGRWVEIPKSKLDNGSIQNIPSQYRDSAICRNAIAYFAIVPNVVSEANATGGAWTYSFYGVGTGNGVNFPGGSNVATRIADNVGWSYQQGADYLYRKNFICLDNPNVVTTNEWRYEVRDTGNSSDAFNESGLYSRTTTVTPQPVEAIVDGKPKMVTDPIGATNLNAQSVIQKTNFGNVYDEYRRAVEAPGANAKNIVAQFKAKFANARAADAAAKDTRKEVALNKGNQDGLGEGGILNVNEHIRNASAVASTSTNSRQVWRCGWDHWSKSGWQPSGCQAVGGSINPDNLDRAGKAFARWDSQGQRDRYNPSNSGATSWTTIATTERSSLASQQQTGFWQILAAHCNAQGIAALSARMGTDLVALDSGDSSKSVSGLVRTKFYDAQPTVLPLGQDHSSLSSAQRATSKLGFFDKECPFDCTPDRSGAGASDKNKAKSNVSDDKLTSTAVKGRYGAKSDGSVNSSYSEMFRDNIERTVRPDVWYPITGEKGVSYDGSAPKTTMVTRWEGGTPTLGTEFNAFALKDGKKISLFDATKDASQPNQRNFDAAEGYTSLASGQVPGLVTDIEVKSTWASTIGSPQSLQIAWEYTPKVASRVPSTVSFTSGGGLNIKSFANVSTGIDGRCWAEYGTKEQTSSSKMLAASELRAGTGTGSVTRFLGTDGEETNSRNLVLNFVRGTSE